MTNILCSDSQDDWHKNEFFARKEKEMMGDLKMIIKRVPQAMTVLRGEYEHKNDNSEELYLRKCLRAIGYNKFNLKAICLSFTRDIQRPTPTPRRAFISFYNL